MWNNESMITHFPFNVFDPFPFQKQMAYDAKYLKIPQLRWLGAFASDFEKYNLPEQCLIPLTFKGAGSLMQAHRAHTRTLHFQMLFSVFLICWRSCLTCQTRVELKPCYKDATCVERYNIGGKIFYHYSSSFLLSLLHALPFSTKSTSSLRLELESMLERGVKFEIEALSVHNISFLSDEYLPSKIESELTLLNS